MEAPEKIYVKITHPISDKYTEIIAFEHGDGVEYTRTDAFIEKAKNWLYLQLNEINMEGEDMANFLKDFKNYMEE